jgi:hypothetical protein
MTNAIYHQRLHANRSRFSYLKPSIVLASPAPREAREASIRVHSGRASIRRRQKDAAGPSAACGPSNLPRLVRGRGFNAALHA